MISLASLASHAWSIGWALAGITFLVAFHEFGHLLFAKLFGVYAPSFSIGFGPRLIGKKIGETTYYLSAIPLGGYVEIAGNAEPGQGDQEFAKLAGDRSFRSKPYWQKFLIMIGGILFNIMFAYAVFAFLFYKGGSGTNHLAQHLQPTIKTVMPHSSAALAGLKEGDSIQAIASRDGEKIAVKTAQDIASFLEKNDATDITVTVQRNAASENIPLTLITDKNGKIIPTLGVFWDIPAHSMWDSAKQAGTATKNMVKEIAHAIYSLAGERKTASVGGPLMLIAQMKNSTALGYKFFLFLLAAISINLAVLNILPLPIFDGGQIVLETIEAIARRPISEATRERIQTISWLLVMALVAYLSYKDILNLFFK